MIRVIWMLPLLLVPGLAIGAKRSASKATTQKAAPKTTLAFQYYSKGVELGARKKYQEALDKFREAIDLNPNYISSYIEYARNSVLLGNRADALNKLNTGISLAHRKEDLERLEKERNSLSEIFFTNDTFQQYQNGLNYLRLERSSSAVESLERALKTEPDNVLILAAYAKALQSDLRTKDAIDALERALALNEGSVGVRLDLAELLLPQKPSRSLALVRGGRADQNRERYTTLEGRALSALKRNKEALVVLKDYAEKNQDAEEVHYWLGKLYSLEPDGAWNARKYLMIFLRRKKSGEDKGASSELRQLRALKKEAEVLLERVNQTLE